MDRRPLSAMLRAQVDDDEELRRLRDELKAHLYRGIAWWDTDRQQIAARRLRQLAPGLPPVVQPVALATVAAQLAGAPYYPSAADVQAAMRSHRYRGRLAAVLVEYFGQLQGGALVATGRMVINPVTSTFIPYELWSAKATAVDVLTGDVLVGDTRAFIDVTVSSPPTRSASRAAIDKFVAAFDGQMLAAGRRYVIGELVDAAQQHLSAGIKAKVAGIQKAMATAVAGVEEIRQAIADLRAERQKIAAAPVPASEATALLDQMLDRWEAGGRNRYIGLEPIIQAATSGQVPQIEIHQSATIGHILGLLVPMLRPQLEAALTAAVEGHYQTVPPGLPADARVARLREIDAELGKLEAAEEEAIAAAAEGGLHVDRRGDASPAAVLGLTE